MLENIDTHLSKNWNEGEESRGYGSNRHEEKKRLYPVWCRRLPDGFQTGNFPVWLSSEYADQVWARPSMQSVLPQTIPLAGAGVGAGAGAGKWAGADREPGAPWELLRIQRALAGARRYDTTVKMPIFYKGQAEKTPAEALAAKRELSWEKQHCVAYGRLFSHTPSLGNWEVEAGQYICHLCQYKWT